MCVCTCETTFTDGAERVCHDTMRHFDMGKGALLICILVLWCVCICVRVYVCVYMLGLHECAHMSNYSITGGACV